MVPQRCHVKGFGLVWCGGLWLLLLVVVAPSAAAFPGPTMIVGGPVPAVLSKVVMTAAFPGALSLAFFLSFFHAGYGLP